MLGIFVYRGIYFGLFDTFSNSIKDTNSNFMMFVFAHGITTFAGICSYPLDTLKNRLMMQSCRPDSSNAVSTYMGNEADHSEAR